MHRPGNRHRHNYGRAAPMKTKITRRIAVSVITDLILLWIDCWLVMLLLGWAHSHDRRVPAFGLVVVFLLVTALSIVVRTASRDAVTS